MKHLNLYGFAGSTYLRTVEMVCLHKNIKYSLKPLEFRTQSHRALHPFLRMPIMEHEGFVLFESLAICSYLEDMEPAVKMLPTSAKEKAISIQWISAFIDYLAPVLIKGKPQEASQSWPERTGEYLKILDQNLARHPFMAGAQPGLADLYLSPAIDYALGGQGFDDLLAQNPHLLAWWQKASACSRFEQTQVA
ncbi:glutathione S-transferase [Alteromonadaceae bacterium Bs31]|nr:glutathione S-transferase [Alteromonadaceae bacterium Bs31]